MSKHLVRSVIFPIVTFQVSSHYTPTHHTGSVFIGTEDDEFYGHTIQCDDQADCTVDCSNHASICRESTILCPDNGNCVIHCHSGSQHDVCTDIIIDCPHGDCTLSCQGESACTNAEINAQDASSLDLTCGTGFTCSGLTVYFPPNVDGSAVATVSAGDDSGLNGRGKELQFYAINGWADVDIVDYTGSYQFHDGQMHCGFEYGTTCNFHDSNWSCATDTKLDKSAASICDRQGIGPVTVAVPPNTTTIVAVGGEYEGAVPASTTMAPSPQSAQRNSQNAETANSGSAAAPTAVSSHLLYVTIGLLSFFVCCFGCILLYMNVRFAKPKEAKLPPDDEFECASSSHTTTTATTTTTPHALGGGSGTFARHLSDAKRMAEMIEMANAKFQDGLTIPTPMPLFGDRVSTHSSPFNSTLNSPAILSPNSQCTEVPSICDKDAKSPPLPDAPIPMAATVRTKSSTSIHSVEPTYSAVQIVDDEDSVGAPCTPKTGPSDMNPALDAINNINSLTTTLQPHALPPHPHSHQHPPSHSLQSQHPHSRPHSNRHQHPNHHTHSNPNHHHRRTTPHPTPYRANIRIP